MIAFSFPNRLSTWLAVGGEFDVDGLHGDATLLYEAVRDWFREGSQNNGFGTSNANRDAFCPSVVIDWTPICNVLSFSGFARRTYRMPTFNDLYYTAVGNSRLSPETADQFGLSSLFQYRISRKILSELKVEAYRNNLKDKILAVPGTNMFRWSMMNIGKVRINGIEVKYGFTYDAEEFSSDPKRDGFDVVVKYTWQQARDYSDPKADYYKGQIPYIPLHSGSASVSAVRNGWRINLSAIASSRRWYISTNTPDYAIDPYMTIDMWVSKVMKIGNRSLTCRLSLNNILNEQYEVIPRYPMPGFNTMGTLEYSF